jgi:hypothetical protein
LRYIRSSWPSWSWGRLWFHGSGSRWSSPRNNSARWVWSPLCWDSWKAYLWYSCFLNLSLLTRNLFYSIFGGPHATPCALSSRKRSACTRRKHPRPTGLAMRWGDALIMVGSSVK